VDGNKRAAVTATGIFLELNGQRLTASNEEVLRLAVKMAAEVAEPVEIAAWLGAP
jgi:prophage maintenance system killer protein